MNRLLALAVLTLVLTLTACSSDDDSDVVSDEDTSFRFSSTTPFARDSLRLEAYINSVNNLSNIVNGQIVDVVFDDCGVSTAFFTIENDSPVIFMCGELRREMEAVFLGEFNDSDLANFTTNHALAGRLGQEMGIALLELTGQAVVDISTQDNSDFISVVLSVERGAGRGMESIYNGIFIALTASIRRDRGTDMICRALGGQNDLRLAFDELNQAFINNGRDCVAEYSDSFTAVQQLFIPDIRQSLFEPLPPIFVPQELRDLINRVGLEILLDNS